MLFSSRSHTANDTSSNSNGHSQGDSTRDTNSRPPPNSRPEGAPTNSGHSPTSKFIPITSTSEWSTFEGFLQRLTFALTMGLAAVALSALLWIVSLPWVAWSLLSWFHRWDRPPVRHEVSANKSVRMIIQSFSVSSQSWRVNLWSLRLLECS